MSETEIYIRGWLHNIKSNDTVFKLNNDHTLVFVTNGGVFKLAHVEHKRIKEFDNLTAAIQYIEQNSGIKIVKYETFNS